MKSATKQPTRRKVMALPFAAMMAAALAKASPAARGKGVTSKGDTPLPIYSECMKVLAFHTTLSCRPDLLEKYLAGDTEWLLKAGFAPKLLAEARPVVEANKEALRAGSAVLERLVRHICYCLSECPGDPAMEAIILFIMNLQQPLTGV